MSKVEKFRSSAKGLIAAVRVNAEFVLDHRNRLDCGPGQSASLTSFLNSASEKEQVWIDHSSCCTSYDQIPKSDIHCPAHRNPQSLLILLNASWKLCRCGASREAFHSDRQSL